VEHQRTNESRVVNGTSVIGIPWYRPENYDQLRKLFVDGNKLPNTCGEWLASVKRLEKSSNGEGVFIFHAYIELNTLPTWLLAKGMKLDAQARSAFTIKTAF
jgi:hypothetical protein